MSNMDLWNKVGKTNPNHTKEVKFGRKFTAIDAHSQIQEATRAFGPCGQGWGVRNGNYNMLVVNPADPNYNLLEYTAELWYKLNDKEGVIEIASAIELFEDTRNGWKRAQDAHKKVKTDALTKGLSWLGFNADVFMGLFDDNKYVQSVRNEFNEKAQAEAQQAKEDLSKAKRSIKDTMKAMGWDSDQCKAYLNQMGIDWGNLNLPKAESLLVDLESRKQAVNA